MKQKDGFQKLNYSFVMWTNETVVDKCLQFPDEGNENDGMKGKVTFYSM